MNRKVFQLFLWLGLTLSLYAGSVYDEYQNGERFAQFDALMNQVRFPTSSPQKIKKWVTELESAKATFPDYPQMSFALYFLGQYNLELKNFSDSLEYLQTAKKNQPELSNSTPIDRYIEECENYLFYRNLIWTNVAILLGWSALIIFLLWLKWKRKDLKSSRSIFWAFLVVSLLVLILFSLSTANWSDGMADYYCPPTLVKSSLLSPGSLPLWKLFFVSIFTCGMVTLSALAVKKNVLIFSLLTALLIGGSSTVLYYQMVCHDVADRTGINLPKRMTFKETIIEWHKDVPDEMLPMYDKRLQLLIQDAKAADRKEKGVK